MAAQCMKSSSGPPSHSPRRAASCTRHGLTSRPVNRTCQGVGTGARWVDRGTGAAGPAWLVVREPRGRPAEAIPRTRRPRSRTRRRPRALFWVVICGGTSVPRSTRVPRSRQASALRSPCAERCPHDQRRRRRRPRCRPHRRLGHPGCLLLRARRPGTLAPMLLAASTMF